jgi:membrane protease YdiL (CAAX protease family)
MKPRQLFAILFFFVSLRALTTLLLASNTQISDHASSISGVFWFGILLAICVILIKRGGEQLPRVSDIRSAVFTIWNGIIVALTLVGFVFGEHAVEVLVASNIDVRLAYRLWDFRAFYLEPPDFLSFDVAMNFLSAVILAPAAEELFFRKLLIESLNQKYSTRAAVLISSLVFSALHFHAFHFLSTMVFAITLALLYLKSRSILICITAHSIFNIFATFYDLYSAYPMITEQNITDLRTWLPYLVMFAFSVFALALLALRFQRLYGIEQRHHAAVRIPCESADSRLA